MLGVWPLHGMLGTWGGILAGISGDTELGGLGGVSFTSQLAGSLLAIAYALTTGFIVYSVLIKVFSFRLEEEDDSRGFDLTIHHITAYPEGKIS